MSEGGREGGDRGIEGSRGRGGAESGAVSSLLLTAPEVAQDGHKTTQGRSSESANPAEEMFKGWIPIPK